jgi:predicted Fe-S protein YdhL (DUF1289 family)
VTHEALPHPPLPQVPAIDLPASPCVRNCCLDDDDVCLGCGRKLDEILAWHGADTAGRQQILASAAERRDARRQRRGAL